MHHVTEATENKKLLSVNGLKNISKYISLIIESKILIFIKFSIYKNDQKPKNWTVLLNDTAWERDTGPKPLTHCYCLDFCHGMHDSCMINHKIYLLLQYKLHILRQWWDHCRLLQSYQYNLGTWMKENNMRINTK